MSSLRNAVKRVTHKERSQPRNRAHLGILEKKKDYKQRAQDYHKKQDVLTSLRRKAGMRNPDEFYFGMKNSEINQGRHRKLEQAKQKERIAEIGHAAVKLMKSQDLSYVRMQTMKDSRKIERMQASLHYLGDNPMTIDDDEDVVDKKRKHTVFVDNQSKADNFDVVEHFDTVPELAGRSFNRPRKETLLKIGGNADGYYDDSDGEQQQPSEKELKKRNRFTKKQAKVVSKARASAYAEMEARTKRVELLKNAEAHLVTEKIVASKGRKRKIKEGENGKPAVYKFRRQRAR
jgi:U3 small nucleolar RNA-associated protein 11|eukprot:scaffold1909_cov247-Chaetoceros_neogracile.AAC.1